MIISTVTIKKFDQSASETILPELTSLSNALHGIRPPGLIQAMLLRDRSGGAMLLVQWRSRGDIEKFIESDRGREIATRFARIIGKRASEFRDYFVTWQTDLPEVGDGGRGCGR